MGRSGRTGRSSLLKRRILLTKSSLLTVALGSGVALLAACSRNGLAGSPSALSSTTQVQTQSGLTDQATKRGLAELSVADRGLNEVLEFNKTYKPTGTISDSGPDADWIDAKGNLYVTNFLGQQRHGQRVQ